MSGEVAPADAARTGRSVALASGRRHPIPNSGAGEVESGLFIFLPFNTYPLQQGRSGDAPRPDQRRSQTGRCSSAFVNCCAFVAWRVRIPPMRWRHPRRQNKARRLKAKGCAETSRVRSRLVSNHQNQLRGRHACIRKKRTSFSRPPRRERIKSCPPCEPPDHHDCKNNSSSRWRYKPVT